MIRLNRTKTVTLAFAGAVLSLAALLIYIILPGSELANGIQYSGKQALGVLALTPIFSFVGALNFMYAFLKDHKVWTDILSKPIVISSTVILSVLMIFNFAVYLSCFLTQFKLGFVAPYDGTVYETLEILLIVVTTLQFIFSAFSIAATIKNK